MNRPDCCTDEMLRFLDALRESGLINMFGAAIPLADMYPELTRQQAREVLAYWMQTFGERHE